MKKLLSELPQAEVAQGVSGEGHVPCSIGNSRLVLTLFRKGGGYRTVEIRHGLVYEGTRYLGSLKSPTDRFVAEFLKDARERPINPAAEILRSSPWRLALASHHLQPWLPRRVVRRSPSNAGGRAPVDPTPWTGRRPGEG